MNTYGEGLNKRVSDYLNVKAGLRRIPLNGTFELSPICNFSCKMCYVRKTVKEVEEDSRGFLTLADWRRIAYEAKEQGTLYLLLTGGEPLLWPHFWSLYEELIDLGFLVSINTNGSLIDEAALARFRKRPPHKINITLYGASNAAYQCLCGVSGVFEKVKQSIEHLIDSDITVKLNCSLTPDNAGDLEWIVEYAKEKQLQLTVATYMFPPIRRKPMQIGVNERFSPEESAKYLMRYIELYRDRDEYIRYLRNIVKGCAEILGLDEECINQADGTMRCRAGRSMFWITWDGWMTPCGLMAEPKIDLTQEDFAAAWNFLTKMTSALGLSGVCKQCPNNEICRPCAAVAYAETGTISGTPTYMCKVTQEMQRIAKKTLYVEDIKKENIPRR